MSSGGVSGSPGGMSNVGSPVQGGLQIGDFADELKKTIDMADTQVDSFINEHSKGGDLKLSAGESLELQKLMAEQGVVSNVATGGLKGISDSEKAVARNI